MLSRVANKTTIHGVKDAWRANWVGRVFFLTVFACCFTLGLLQLKGLFHGYISEAVGTRVERTTKFDSIEVPSVYYCNDNWLPKSEALLRCDPIIDVNSSLYKSSDELYKECIHVARYNVKDLPPEAKDPNGRTIYLRARNQLCRPFLEYWKSMIKQSLVNAIVRPLEDGFVDFRGMLLRERQRRPELSVMTANFASSILADPIQTLLNSEFAESLKRSVEDNVLNVTGDNIGTNRSCTTCAAKYKSSSSVMSPVIDISGPENTFGNLAYYYDSSLAGYYSWKVNRRHDYDNLANSTLHPSAISTSFDGVCWEYPAGPRYLPTKEAVGRKLSHVVVHLGGLVHRLRILHSRVASAIDQRSASFMRFPSVGSYFRHILDTLVNFAIAQDMVYHTYVAVSKQNEPGLYFGQKLRIDSPLVNIKYWKRSVTHLNRKASPCRPDPWSELDQAHCNQELYRSRQIEVSCETYLPASDRYPETPITTNTCIYDRAYLFKDIVTALSDLVIKNKTIIRQPLPVTHQLSTFGPPRVSYDYRRDVILRLTKASPNCPRPCSRTEFNHQASYATRVAFRFSNYSFDVRNRNARHQCQLALAYWLTPRTHLSFPDRLVPPFFPKSDTTPKELFAALFRVISEVFSEDELYPFCSVIEFEQTETDGKVSEEYLLYAFDDLAANLGGTAGLWIGASVISFVQLMYLCWLETLFRKIQRKVAEVRAEGWFRQSVTAVVETIQDL